jgi:hydrogenase small subunit
MSLTRRDAIKQMLKVIAAVGAANFFSYEDLLAMENGKMIKPNIVWLHGSSCSGCSCSFLNIEDVSVLDILTRYTNIIYHPDVSLATGKQVIDLLDKASKELKNNYLLVVEGSIPVAMPHACMMGDRPIMEWMEQMSSSATACVAAGTCAAFGGITGMQGMDTGVMSISNFVKAKKINKPVVALPNCPMKPEHMIYVIFHYAKFKTIPQLDAQGRPLRFFSQTVHERCIYYSEFQEKNYAKKIGEAGCMLKLGCQGPVTKNDCMQIGHNNNTNTCIKAGHPCIGCASEHFPRQIMMHTFHDKRAIAKFKNFHGQG